MRKNGKNAEIKCLGLLELILYLLKYMYFQKILHKIKRWNQLKIDQSII